MLNDGGEQLFDAVKTSDGLTEVELGLDHLMTGLCPIKYRIIFDINMQ